MERIGIHVVFSLSSLFYLSFSNELDIRYPKIISRNLCPLELKYSYGFQFKTKLPHLGTFGEGISKFKGEGNLPNCNFTGESAIHILRM